METADIIANYGINAAIYSDYLLLIAPSDGVKEMVRKYKLSSARMIGNYDGMHNPAHISVTKQHRQMPVTMGQKLDSYQRFVERLKPIELRIAGFGYFTHGRQGFTIYAKIELNAEVTQWFGHLGRIFGERHAITPHIAIAKNIPPHAFKMLWAEFSVREYGSSFTPDALTVLRRPTINISNQYWVPFKELHFGK
jgi:hypothetical protein